jgi:hypothetical protein
MSFRVEFSPRLRRQLIEWQLPDAVLVEIHIRLREDLANTPGLVLQRTQQPLDGLVYSHSMTDPNNPDCLHVFNILVSYSQDEECITLERGAYARLFGF